jgi:hypothetical protein
MGRTAGDRRQRRPPWSHLRSDCSGASEDVGRGAGARQVARAAGPAARRRYARASRATRRGQGAAACAVFTRFRGGVHHAADGGARPRACGLDGRPRPARAGRTGAARGAHRIAASSFGRLRVSCGGAEITPVHPFVFEHRLSDTNTVREGLYVFDHAALGPHCGTVTLTLVLEQRAGQGGFRDDRSRRDPPDLGCLAPYRASTPQDRAATLTRFPAS